MTQFLSTLPSLHGGRKVCHYQTLKKTSAVPAPITYLVQFIKYQPAYISQYYAHIKCEIPEAEVYQEMKATKKIIMVIDRGGCAFKDLLGFVLTDSKNKVLMSCYGRAPGHDPLSFQSEASTFLAVLCI